MQFDAEESVSSVFENLNSNNNNCIEESTFLIDEKKLIPNNSMNVSSISDVDNNNKIILPYKDEIQLTTSSSLIQECSTNISEDLELNINNCVEECFSFSNDENKLLINNSVNNDNESISDNLIYEFNISDVDNEKENIPYLENQIQSTTSNIYYPFPSLSLLQGCPIVIDFGTSLTRVGFSSEIYPSNIFPTVIGKQKNQYHVMGMISDSQDCYGNKAILNHVFLNIHCLLRNGEVYNWENMKDFIKYTLFVEMGIKNLENHPILIAEPLIHSKDDRLKLTEFLFEEMGISLLFLASQASLALLGAERKTGIVVDCGEGITSIEAIYEGYIVHPMKTINSHLSGRFLTDSFINLLQQSAYISPSILQNNINFNAQSGKVIAQNLKESFCCIREKSLIDYESLDFSSAKIEDYILPDDTVLSVDSKIGVECGEKLFNSNGLGEKISLQSLIVNCVERCEPDLRSELYKNVVLCGGSTLIDGFAKRLRIEIQKEMRQKNKSSSYLVNVIALNDRQHLVWKGGAVLANSSMFQSMCVTKEEYDEFGSLIINYKCFN